MKTRIHFLDNIRTFAIFLVVVIHAGLVYEHVLENLWIVDDPQKIDSLGLVRMYLDLFVMYSIFFVSGYLIPYSLKNKTDKEFLVSKFKRILWPWILAVFTLIPAYKIIFLYSRGLPQEVWYSYFHIFQRQGADLGFFANNPSQNWLWFLPILFAFQVLYLILTKVKLIPIKLSVKTSVIIVFIVGVVYSMLISSTGLAGWFHSGFFEFQRERLVPYFLIFLLGTVVKEQGVFQTTIKNTKLYITSNVVLTLALGVFTVVALNLFFNLIDPARDYYFISPLADRTVYYMTALLSTLSFLYILIYAFRFYFNKTNRLMDHLNQYSYSVYIIHMIVLGLIAIPLVKMPIPSIAKFFLLTILTFAISNFLVYGYRQLFQKRLYLKLTASAVLLVAFFAFTETSNESEIMRRHSASIEQSELKPPAIGLHQAALEGNLAAIQEHIRIGSDLNEKEPTNGSSPIITAVTFGKSEVVDALIKAGADINLVNNDGSTPLITAAFFCRTDIVEILLANGADATIENKSGSTALNSVTAPFEAVKDIYDYFGQTLGPIGLKLDYDHMKKARPEIAKILQDHLRE